MPKFVVEAFTIDPVAQAAGIVNYIDYCKTMKNTEQEAQTWFEQIRNLFPNGGIRRTHVDRHDEGLPCSTPVEEIF